MKKIFFNAFSYNHGGWFICEAQDWPYKNKVQPIFGSRDVPEVKAFWDEVSEVRQQLHEELVQVAVDLKLHICDIDGKAYNEGDKIDTVVIEDDAEGKKLMDALIALGWEYSFIPIGP